MTVINFKNLSLLLFQNKTNKAKQTSNSQNSNTLPSARQTTNQRSSNATIPRNCNQLTVLQRQTRNTVFALLFRTKIKHRFPVTNSLHKGHKAL